MTSVNQSFFRSSNIYFLFALVIFAASTFYGITKWNLLQAAKAAVIENQKEIEVISGLFKKTKEEFQSFADEQTKRQKDFEKKISAILPLDENYTELARQFDDYFGEADKPGNPIFQGNLNFQKGQVMKDATGISVLPFSMSLEGTRDNLFKFLEFINNSGSLESGIRLMEIKSVDLSFAEGGEQIDNPKQPIKFNVNMNAYYQTQKIAR
ncbi:hypothetical protein HZC21_03290 [Candidatus Peregrinibacteria bacterium]|nr:hypothetical protein [Candidatus Peregrinibacteria bacterium]